ncbi:response regulator transcription factor [Pseudonocardia bannensis]|uniref:Response regulator transcription factor n=1 Tax=Pseudonocardia bannensis TaxID=630973 RepID=A0A848DK33_9PSEU|nr:response regulator transcription factor [Pseudonocardia bannensis]NMH92886.1 response regulator transcription factor [Pseudonocardia bannensis]
MKKLQVLLCDDHRMFREGAKRILDDEIDIQVVGDVSSLDEAAQLAVELTPTVIVLDISLHGGKSGLDGIEILREQCPATKILMASMHQESSFVQAAFARGASGYVTKDAAADDLAAAVRVVSLGGQYVPEFLAEQKAASSHLTARERDVLELLAAGHTNAEISKVLHLSIRTVETYRSQLGRKLNVGSRSDLIRVAKLQGIL